MPDEPNQRHIAQGLREGKADAWQALYDAYADRVWRGVARLLGPQSTEVADVVQETMMAAARSATGFDPARGSLWPWLWGIAHNQVALHLRKQERRTRLTKAGAWLAASDGQWLSWLEGKEPSPPVALAVIELATLVRAALTALPVDYGMLLTARYLDGDTVAAIAHADPPYLGPWSGSATWLRQTNLLKPVEGTSLEIAGGQTLSVGQPVAVSGRRLRLQVSAGSGSGFVPQGASGTLAVSDGQTFLVEAFPPGNLAGNNVWLVSTLSGVTGTLTTGSANIVLLPGDKSDPMLSESAVITQVTVAGAITTLGFDQALNRIYDRATVTVNANTVDATHGETVHEILGSGDATNAALQFTLKQSPLTYVSSSSASGVQSTLQVWVNNLQWHETGNFLTALPADRSFVTLADRAGNAIVQFGDGEEGARPPTGQMNIRAMYRKGIGAAGMVSAGQLSQALDRPQGLKSVTNPDPATGGADPDSAADARISAPLHVLTLDRVVSLEDYQNFARAFAGIDKVLATWTWFGKTRGVFLSVAGAGGSQFNAGDPTIVHLTQALQSAGNPFVLLNVVSFTPVLFEIAGNVRIDGVDYDPNEVLGRVWQGLAAAFAFENRDLAQGVAQSEVVALIQNTAGVVAVELTAFNRSGQAAASPLPAVLQAAAPVAGGNVTPQAAEMLLLDPASRANIGAWS